MGLMPMTDYLGFYKNQTSFDPTRTASLMARWMADWKRRLKALEKVVLKAVVDQDVFGLKEAEHFPTVSADLDPPEPRKFAYRYAPEKVTAFMEWLRSMEEKTILEIIHRPGTLRPKGEPWSDVYVRSAYQKGLEFARSNVTRRSTEVAQKMGLEVFPPPGFGPSGGAISTIMQQPFHADRLALMHTRVFEELKGVSAEMDKNISMVLTEGLAHGLNPRQIGEALAKKIPDIAGSGAFDKARYRGTLIARTETINVHAQAALNEYYSIEKTTGEVVLIQWKATHDSRVRDTHLARDMRVYTKEEAYALIGEPNCRCALLPYIPAAQGMPAKASNAARKICAKIVEEENKRKD